MTDPMLMDLKAKVVKMESAIAAYVGKVVNDMAATPGHAALSNELVASVASLFAARSVAWLHATTTEPVEKIKDRFTASFEDNLKLSLATMARAVEEQGKAK